MSFSSPIPLGTILPYAGNTTPSGYLRANGLGFLKTSFPQLSAYYSAQGYPFGSSATFFNTPDLRGRTTRNGSVTSGGGGEYEHPLAHIEMPTHSHSAGTLALSIGTVLNDGNNHCGLTGLAGELDNFWLITSVFDTGTTRGIAGNLSAPPLAEGAAHNNLPPWLALNYIVKATAGISIPVGTIMRFPSHVNPSGWLVANGSAYSAATYPNLNTIIGPSFGLFTPDLRGCFAYGMDAMGALASGRVPTTAIPTSDTLGGRPATTQGEEWSEIRIRQFPSHVHDAGTLRFDGQPASWSGVNTSVPNPGVGYQGRLTAHSSGLYDLTIFGGAVQPMSGQSAGTFGGIAPRHNNMPSYVTFQWCIKT